jgi:hypothetical protein
MSGGKIFWADVCLYPTLALVFIKLPRSRTLKLLQSISSSVTFMPFHSLISYSCIYLSLQSVCIDVPKKNSVVVVLSSNIFSTTSI